MLGRTLATTAPQMRERLAGQRARWPVAAQIARLWAAQSCHLATLCLCSLCIPPAFQTVLLAPTMRTAAKDRLEKSTFMYCSGSQEATVDLGNEQTYTAVVLPADHRYFRDAAQWSKG